MKEKEKEKILTMLQEGINPRTEEVYNQTATEYDKGYYRICEAIYGK